MMGGIDATTERNCIEYTALIPALISGAAL